MKKAIVIGSGFGGLAIACRLKKNNFDVLTADSLKVNNLTLNHLGKRNFS